MKPYTSENKQKSARNGKYKTKNERKAKWSRLLLHNAERADKKNARQEAKQIIKSDLNNL